MNYKLQILKTDVSKITFGLQGQQFPITAQFFNVYKGSTSLTICRNKAAIPFCSLK